MIRCIFQWATFARVTAGLAICTACHGATAPSSINDSLPQAIMRTIWGPGQAAQLPVAARTLRAAEVGMQLGLSAADGFIEEYPDAEFVVYTSDGYPELEWGFRTFLVRHATAGAVKSSRLLIYNHGHVGWYFSAPTSRALLCQAYKGGYDLLLTVMPMVGWNTPTHPIRAKTWDGWGEFKPTAESHSFFAMLDTGVSHYLKFFLDPVISPLRQVLDEWDYQSVDIVGLSGGGWTALLVGAVEPKIRKIVSVAGFLPMRHRNKSRDFGDSEQVSSSFYQKHPYDQLVVAASQPAANGRELWLLYNNDDPCCFGGDEAERYANELRAQGNTSVRIMIRRSQAHDLDPAAILQILDTKK